MLIDHVGYFLLNNNIVCRIIGRLALPIFAFFIAEGMRYTKSRKRYILTLLGFACLSQVPYCLALGKFKLNTLFTFLIAIVLILLIECLTNKSQKKTLPKTIFVSLAICLIFLSTFIFGLFDYVDYSIYGVLLILCFYFIKHPIKHILGIILMFLMTLQVVLISEFTFRNMIQIFSILAFGLLLLYNNQKGKANLKYLFYVFYPAHLLIIWIMTLII